MATIKQRIEHNLKLGRLPLAKEALKEKYNKEHMSARLEAMRAEYDVTYPSIRLMTEVEWNEVNESDLTWSELSDEDKSELSIVIDYSEDENYVTFNEWLNETRVIQEAVDAKGNLEDDTYVEPVLEITEPVRPYTTMTTEVLDGKVSTYFKENYSSLREQAYPDWKEFADAWVKNDEIAMEEYRAKCLVVKAKYPKV